MVKFGKKINSLLDSASLYHSLAYDVLKKAINVVVADGKDAQAGGAGQAAELRAVDEALGQSAGALATAIKPPDSRFHGLLTHELTKVNRFANLQLRTLLDTLREAQGLVGRPGPHEDESLSEMEHLLDSAAEQIVALEQFRRLNFTGFRKIVKKFDKRCRDLGAARGSLGSWFLPMLLREPFLAQPLDAHLLALAWGYAALRRHRRGANCGAFTTPVPSACASAAAAVTSTFWLTPPERMRALCALIKRFEIVAPPTGLPSEPLASPAALAEKMRRLLQTMAPDGQAKGPCQLRAATSMVYYDAPDFREYVGRLEGDGPRGFRCRRTVAGSQGLGTAHGELVERDGAPSALGAHAFTPVLELHAPDAFPLDAAAAAAVPAGPDELLLAACRAADGQAAARLRPADQELLRAFVAQVQETVTGAAAEGASLAPVATVRTSRVLLRGDTSATEGISIAVDDDVQFGRAAAAPGDAVDFPFNLLEIANEHGENTAGSWLEELRSYASLQTIQGFSAGAHAVACLHKDSVPKLPSWYQHLNDVESWGPLELWGLMHEWRQAVAEEGGEGGDTIGAVAAITSAAPVLIAKEAPRPSAALPAVGSAGQPAPPTTEMPALEPKNYLASERTMLEWIHTVLALSFVAIGLWKYSLSLRAADGRLYPAAGGLVNAATMSSLVLGCYSLALVALAVCFAWYAVLSHTTRLHALQENRFTEGVFNRRLGPGGFVFAVGVALLSHLLVQVVPLWLALGRGDQDDPVAASGAVRGTTE